MEIILIVCSYLLGSIPTGYILGALVGVDVRTVGSGNVGATNVARSVGKGWGAVTLVADAAKGFIPVLVAGQLRLSPEAVAIAAISAFLGHLFPLFLKFQGGKGVATALGIFLALAPMATLALAAVFAVVLASSRIVSLSSMVTALAAPISLWSFAYSPTYIAMGAFIAAMIILRHRANIQRLIAGTEPRFGSH
jgi:glycerol-3-phosphate acyltransferase PlsY